MSLTIDRPRTAPQTVSQPGAVTEARPSGRGGSRVPQVDVLKGLAIIGVMLIHGIPRDYWYAQASARPFSYGQAVPVFLVLLGMNGLRKARRRESSLFTREYFAGQVDRIVVPVVVAWIVALLIGLAAGKADISDLWWTGHLPLNGPGNYFIAVMLQWIIVLPVLALAYRRAPGLTVVGCFALAVAVEFVATKGAFDGEPYLFRGCILRYLPTIALGMYMLDRRRWPWWMYAGILVSIWYLVAAIYIPDDLPNRDFRLVTYAAPTAFYAAALVRLALARLPDSRVLTAIGAASLHIFLAQVIWFALFDHHDTWAHLGAAVLGCCAIGYAAFRLMERLTPATSLLRRTGVRG